MTIHPRFTNQKISAISCGSAVEDAHALHNWSATSKYVVKLDQQHTNSVLVWRSGESPPDWSQPADAVLTDLPNTALTLRTADCVPILISHRLTASDGSESTVVGAIHAGRRGTEATIVALTLTKLLAIWGKGKTELWLGPHICSNCYQINQETGATYNLRVNIIKQVEVALPTDSYLIMHSEHCTLESPEWFSYRRGDETARNLTGIRIQE